MYYGARYYAANLGRFAQPDSLIPDQFNPQSLNRYSYVGNNPVRYRDPDGHCWPVCTVMAGAAIGGGIRAVSYTVTHLDNFSWADLGKAAAVGAVAGAVGGATFGVGTAVLGTGLGATIATGAVAGAVAGQASIATDNALSGREVTDGRGNPNDIARDAAIGGAMAGAVRVGGNVLAQRAEQNAVTTVYRAL